jgi:hypothetical protein
MISGSISDLGNALVRRSSMPTSSEDSSSDLKALLTQQQILLEQIAANSTDMKKIAHEQQSTMQMLGQSLQTTATLQAAMLQKLEQFTQNK